MGAERKAVFAGYFNPFHMGHAYVIDKCLKLKLADKILVYVTAREKAKGRVFAGLEERRAIIKKWVKLRGLGDRVHVYEGRAESVDFFKKHGYTQKICGADIFSVSLKLGWNEFKLAKELIVFERPYSEIEPETVGYYTKELGKVVRIIPSKIGCVSSSDICYYIQTGALIAGLVPHGLEPDIRAVYAPLLAKK